MNTHNVPTTTLHPHECGDTAYQAAAMPGECTCAPRRFHVPEWVKRAQAGQLVRKDMTGMVSA